MLLYKKIFILVSLSILYSNSTHPYTLKSNTSPLVTLTTPSFFYFNNHHSLLHLDSTLSTPGSAQIISKNGTHFNLDTYLTSSAVLNGSGTLVNNPLLNCKPLLLSSTQEGLPIIVTAEDPSTLFIVGPKNREGTQQDIVALKGVPDAEGNTNTAIKAVCYGVTGAHDRQRNPHLFVLTSSNNSTTHPAFSIACYEFRTYTTKKQIIEDKKTKEVESKRSAWELISAQTDKQAAFPLSFAECSIDLGGLDSVDTSSIRMQWDPTVERFFLMVPVTTRADATMDQGAAGIFIGRMVNNVLYFDPFCSTNPKSIDYSGTIFGPSKSLAITHALSFIAPSHHLYLITAHTTTTNHSTEERVSAIPLLNYESLSVEKNKWYTEFMNTPYVGSVAALQGKLTSCTMEFKHTHKPQVLERCYHGAPLHDGEPYYRNPQVVVGANILLPGPITSLKSIGGCVVASVDTHSEEQKGGVFYSYPLYDHYGHIVSWTPWQRFLGINANVLDFAVDVDQGTAWFVAAQTTGLTVETTGWQDTQSLRDSSTLKDQDSLLHPLHSLFGTEQGGIVNYAQTADILVLIGTKKVAVVETDITAGQKSTEGVYTVASLEDPLIDSITPLSCGAVIKYQDSSYLLLGGTGGVVAVPLHTTKPSALLGTYSFVKKIIPLSEELLIITDTTLHTISLHDLSSRSMNLPAAGIFDALKVGNVLLLATSQGLWSTFLTTSSYFTWHPITLPSTTGSARELFALVDADQSKAHVFVTSYCPISREATLTSLFVDGTSTDVTTAPPLYSLPEYDLGNHTSFFKPLLCSNALRLGFATDGIFQFTILPERPNRAAEAVVLPQLHRKLSWYKPGLCNPIKKATLGHSITTIFYCSLLGTWVVGGDFGISIAH